MRLPGCAWAVGGAGKATLKSPSGGTYSAWAWTLTAAKTPASTAAHGKVASTASGGKAYDHFKD